MAFKKSRPKYGSDVVADVLRSLGMEYATINPGATLSGLHDSIVNYLGNRDPELILCCHEAIAVSMALGYSQVERKPMAVMLHDTMGLLNATNAIYSAWLVHAPVMLVGGSGPMADEKKLAWIDWIHSALISGNVIRDFVKWDHQPFSLASIPDALIRAYRVAMTEPHGPVYVCLDRSLQEEKLPKAFPKPSPQRHRPPTYPQADPEAITRTAKLLAGAKNPVVIADNLGRKQESVGHLVELAELLALPVIDVGGSFNFPNTHPLDLTGAEEELLTEADLVLALDVPYLARHLTKRDPVTEETHFIISETAKIVHITLHDLILSSWAQSYGKLVPIDIPICADTSLALPALFSASRKLLGRKHSRIQSRFQKLEARHNTLRQQWQKICQKSWDEKPISLPRLAAEIGQVIKGEDWALAQGRLNNWPRRLWDWNKPYQYVGGPNVGVGNGLGYSLGVALAHRKHGRLCIDIQPDGDFLYTPAALWTAAHHQIPLLVIMFNNRSYCISERLQELMASSRGRPTENKTIGTSLENPAVDFAQIAHSFGLYGEGPIEDPHDLRPALKRAVKIVKETKKLALIDVVTEGISRL
jgi:thiamine pyrophosphate-dependent acetolactate synthase large subunit-like protein